MGYVEDLAAKEVARQENNRMRAAEAARVLNQGNPGLASMAAQGYSQEGLSDRDAMALAQQKAIQEAAYARAVEAMKNSKVTNGKIDPAYWEAAQKASDYELGLSGLR